MANIGEVAKFLDKTIPLSYQEHYDNCGLLIGDIEAACTGILVNLEITAAVIEEAIALGINLIVTHHPLIFKGLKKLTNTTETERLVATCIKNNIAVYSAHTNLDHMQFGVNKKIGEKLGFLDLSYNIINELENVLFKLEVMVPVTSADQVRFAMFNAGAGNIGNYSNASFNHIGLGSFEGNENSNPAVGEKGKLEWVKETMVTVLVEQHCLKHVLHAMKAAHPYEEVAYFCTALAQKNQTIGSGMHCALQNPIPIQQLLDKIKSAFNVPFIKHTPIIQQHVQRVGWCGGSGSFLIEKAKQIQLDVFITADLKYHQFFEAENKIVLVDMGHYESEQYTSEIIAEILQENFTTFAVLISKTTTNPVRYH